MTQHTVQITFEVPGTVTRTELRDFIAEALGSWGGQKHPADHLFDSLRELKIKFEGKAPQVSVKVRQAYHRRLEHAINRSMRE